MPNCTDCNSSNPISFSGSWFPRSPCSDSSSGCEGAAYDSTCVYYNGPALPCSEIETLDSLELALQKIDEKLCSILGDYSTYNMHCLPTWWEAAILSEEDFVDAITDYVCTLDETVTTFIETTFVEYQTDVDERFDDIEVPGIVCASAGVINTDNLVTVLTKYCTKFSDIDDAIDMSTVTFNTCITVIGTVDTVAEGMQVLANQICTLYTLIAEGGILPTFNNYGTCIGGTSSDSLSETIDLIVDRLCLTPTYDFDIVTWGCFTEPTTFQEFIETTVAYLNTLNDAKYEFDGGDFTLTPVNPMDSCAGQIVSLATPLNVDRFVASNALDVAPSTLVDKLTSVGSLTFDDSSNTDISIDISDGDKGDIIVSVDGTVWTIGTEAITLAKIQDAVSNSQLLGSGSAGSGAPYTELSLGTNLLISGTTINTYGRTLIGITKFTSSASWSKPTGCTAVVVLSVGAGGGGGGTTSAANASVAGGGGSGAASWNFIESGLGATEAVTIGSGGAGGIGNSNGANGGNTSFGAHVIVNGGDGGITLVEGTAGGFALGGTAGILTGTGAATIIYGGAGSDGVNGIRLSGTMGIHGKGAASFLGGGGNVYSLGSGGDGAAAAIGAATNTGNDGSDGTVIVFSYS